MEDSVYPLLKEHVIFQALFLFFRVGEGRCCLGVPKNYDISLSPLTFAARIFKSIAKMIAIWVLENVIVTTWCVWYTYKP